MKFPNWERKLTVGAFDDKRHLGLKNSASSLGGNRCVISAAAEKFQESHFCFDAF
jgi:hypothetical protein